MNHGVFRARRPPAPDPSRAVPAPVAPGPPRAPGRPTMSVVICAYTMDRWPDLVAAVRSVHEQTEPPEEVILVADHCLELEARARRDLAGVLVVRNRGRRGLSGARNRGVAHARAEIVAFLDDDATAEPTWCARLRDGYRDPGVLGVGGRVRPRWETGRPGWFPAELDWVVGCTYRGMPERPAGVRNLIGANMSFRRDALVAGGGFRGDLGRVGARPLGGEETELCIRLARRGGRLAYDPGAVVDHRVPAARATRGYLVARCWAEGLSKVVVARHAGTARALADERRHLATAIPRALLRPFVRRSPAATIPTLLLGVAAAGLGYLTGRLRGLGRPHPPGAARLALRLFGLLALPVAVLLWVLAMRQPVAVDRMGDLGLVGVLPVRHWAALGLLTAGFAATLLDRRARGPGRVLYTLALLVMLHATPAVLYDNLRYAWAWKHTEVVDQFLRHGQTLSGADAGELAPYHQWPGFFAAFATLVRAMGLDDAVRLAVWAPLAVNVALLAPLVLLYRRFTRGRRLIWTAVWLYYCTAWVGQDYFAPQAFGFLLYVTILALALDRRRPPAVTVLRCLPFLAAAVMSHQLTPLMLAGAFAALLFRPAFRRTAAWLLAVTVAAVLAWDLTIARPFVADRFATALAQLGAFGSNTGSSIADLSAASPGQVTIAWADRALTATVALLAAAGLLRHRGLRRSAAVPLALSPLPMLAAGAYGGEILLRVHLFALPAAAFLGASALAGLWLPHGRRDPLGDPPKTPEPARGRGAGRPRRAGRHARALALPVVFALLLAGFSLGYYGKERQNHFADGEITARRALTALTGPGDLVITATNNFPGAYAEYERNPRRWFATESPELRDAVVRDPVAGLTALAAEYRGAPAYVFLTPGQRAQCDMTGLLPAGTLDRIDATLSASPEFRVVRRNAGTVIFRVLPRASAVPPGTAAEPAVAGRTAA